MGEAKRRGSQTERVEAAIGAVPSPEAMRESMGFAASAKFVGYVVHLPDSDEFLADAMESNAGSRSIGMVPTRTWPRCSQTIAAPPSRRPRSKSIGPWWPTCSTTTISGWSVSRTDLGPSVVQ